MVKYHPSLHYECAPDLSPVSVTRYGIHKKDKSKITNILLVNYFITGTCCNKRSMSICRAKDSIHFWNGELMFDI